MENSNELTEILQEDFCREDSRLIWRLNQFFQKMLCRLKAKADYSNETGIIKESFRDAIKNFASTITKYFCSIGESVRVSASFPVDSPDDKIELYFRFESALRLDFYISE
ncbi:hypothetical protein FHS16_001754 [Paenibacillus endophyticus]|uniref:Uncharacterized protein n=1 Tax=Paenibacillus endophyticus TaxID=1294268 RepID=A0A7W5C619_9BACL|nr:hypothetical protein [Paenibacillus endophyticus]MBB3151708.1 hypothetical protein [Paenibacillus endophyticus]